MEILIGAIGAVVVIGMFAAGALVGWKVCKRMAVQRSTEEVSETERQKLKDREEAYHILQSYDVSVAYGMTDDEGM